MLLSFAIPTRPSPGRAGRESIALGSDRCREPGANGPGLPFTSLPSPAIRVQSMGDVEQNPSAMAEVAEAHRRTTCGASKVLVPRVAARIPFGRLEVTRP